jgi:hypothetical protein
VCVICGRGAYLKRVERVLIIVEVGGISVHGGAWSAVHEDIS